MPKVHPVIVVDPGSGALDFGQKLCGLPTHDPSLSASVDPETGELVIFKDRKEIRREVCDLEPPRPWTDEDQRLREELMAGHLDLSTCVDADGPKIWEPSTFTGPLLPPGPLKLTEHHNPRDDK